MKDKSTITYRLVQPGEDRVESIDILTTYTTKVPEVGEVININTTLEKSWMQSRFSHLSEQQLKALVRSEDSQLRDNFVVVDVKRWLKIMHTPVSADKILEIDFLGSTSTSGIKPEIPVEFIIENFEVYIEPFRHTELTEKPIAKVRNLLGSLFGTFDMVSLISEHPDKEKELLELFKGHIADTKQSIEKLREIIGNDKNWK